MFKIDMLALVAALVSIESAFPGTQWYHEVSIARAILLWRDEGAEIIGGSFTEDLIGRIGQALSRDRKESFHVHKTTALSGCNGTTTGLSLEGKTFLTHFAGDRCNSPMGTEESAHWEIARKNIDGNGRRQLW